MRKLLMAGAAIAVMAAVPTAATAQRYVDPPGAVAGAAVGGAVLGLPGAIAGGIVGGAVDVATAPLALIAPPYDYRPVQCWIDSLGREVCVYR